MSCYQYVFRSKEIKEANVKKSYSLDMTTYHKITNKCIVCGFSTVVDLHHLDNNRKNNLIENLVGLCPNHHRMIHNIKHKGKVTSEIQKKKDKRYNKKPFS